MNRPVHCDDEKIYIRSKPLPNSGCNEHESANVVELSSSDSDTHIGDHFKAFFTINNGKPQSSTFLTSEDSSIVDSGLY